MLHPAGQAVGVPGRVPTALGQRLARHRAASRRTNRLTPFGVPDFGDRPAPCGRSRYSHDGMERFSNPEQDAVDAVKTYMDRIHFSHVRNIQHYPNGDFSEVAHRAQEGSVDPSAS